MSASHTRTFEGVLVSVPFESQRILKRRMTPWYFDPKVTMYTPKTALLLKRKIVQKPSLSWKIQQFFRSPTAVISSQTDCFSWFFFTVNKIYVPWTMKNNHIWCTSAPDFRNHHCLSNSRPGNSRHLHRIGLWPSARKHRCQFSRFATTRTFNEVPSNWHPGSLG